MSEHATDVTWNCSLMQAIEGRRSVRAYAPDALHRETIVDLLKAAVKAPTAMHREPWAFVVIQDRALLRELSVAAHATIDASTRKSLGALFEKDFNIFYDAGTLILICAPPTHLFAAADCWLAAENLMLAACAQGLGSCVIGLALRAVNLPEWKARLGIAADLDVFAPIILGVPAAPTPVVARQAPRVIAWK